MALNLSILALLVDAFIRLKRSVKHEDIALEKNQMFLHIGTFALAVVSIILLTVVTYVILIRS